MPSRGSSNKEAELSSTKNKAMSKVKREKNQQRKSALVLD